MIQTDHERRFGGVARLYGLAGAQKLHASHVCIVGIGGVGSWTVEALARSAVGQMTLIDMDVIAESNTNRQIHALGDEYGKAKIEAMAERVRQINPDCQLNLIDDFITPENTAALLKTPITVVIDAIDQVKAKAALIAHCRTFRIPVVSVGAAGGQMDPTQVQCSDLSQTIQDPLLAKVRTLLRREYAFPKGGNGKFTVPAIFSTEPLRYPEASCTTTNGPAGLNCAGFGSSVCVTSVFGMAAAATAIKLITQS